LLTLASSKRDSLENNVADSTRIFGDAIKSSPGHVKKVPAAGVKHFGADVAMVLVYADETSWRVGRLNSSIWSFTSQLQCVMLFGCSKNRATLESILPPDDFEGIRPSVFLRTSYYNRNTCE
jgi:hypothetical protein